MTERVDTGAEACANMANLARQYGLEVDPDAPYPILEAMVARAIARAGILQRDAARIIEGARHGTTTGYRAGCRCASCCSAKSAASAAATTLARVRVPTSRRPGTRRGGHA